MDLRKRWKALKVWLRGWFSEVFGSGTSETSLSEVSLQKTPSEITEDASDGLVPAVRERLEHLRHNRRIIVRKKNSRMEWLVTGADFTDAYLLLLSVPGADIRQLRHRTAADEITYRLELPGETSAELTDTAPQENTIAVLKLVNDGRCMLRINFLNDIKD